MPPDRCLFWQTMWAICPANTTGDKIENNSPIQWCTMVVFWFKEKPRLYLKGFTDETLQPNSGLVKHIVYYFLLYSGVTRPVCVSECCSILCHMTAANWEAFTDGLLSKVHSCFARLMLWLVYVSMPAISTGLALSNDRAHRTHCSLPPMVHCYTRSTNRSTNVLCPWTPVSDWSDSGPLLVNHLELNCILYKLCIN